MRFFLEILETFQKYFRNVLEIYWKYIRHSASINVVKIYDSSSIRINGTGSIIVENYDLIIDLDISYHHCQDTRYHQSRYTILL